MKRWIHASEEVWYSPESLVPGIAATLSVTSDHAKTIYSWYRMEGAFDDFNSANEFLAYLPTDIRSMLFACDDPDLRDEILDDIES